MTIPELRNQDHATRIMQLELCTVLMINIDTVITRVLALFRSIINLMKNDDAVIQKTYIILKTYSENIF
ncbi:hypothetical protein RhiirA5_362634 [Rhizophagus irregularis]|uniref:Uncharacterized protein n=2 Tax=Rhizophagus irregularis TaxID=588596 RepID=U9TBP4_RHIID|nr:hypothetical protein GLOIN_2v1677775 [Rhizophagus irregularis DAOM 181602=DAOM 197198]PKC04158.1 hypothetical protein RhiirA5_362634 [Rhizophagus irregularis]PKC60564.1 hypothetical protein RhiirA1_425779 [Rhizophagus irregularis]PKY28925.1 hypothetical protein RhiirB3_417530 [Rhizophagus irregularis]POG64207.1 hypothetical protein GLOIN_2v1677775 [Rhizophagus irregularis DAOM 181602=DAOM 197198]GBC21288.2 hypothetical protein GLOIN_2v1677775 [Rhizophagus irregularis DAOM 181602=DAOM 197198|eukprot:XP_025171073.1 hypothetical protein GLOIN_2v1677775 [Rhizophagus irregularis DAOM 181602=DAOM 197198]